MKHPSHCVPHSFGRTGRRIVTGLAGIPALPVMRLLSIGYTFYFRKHNSMFIKRLGRFSRLWQLRNHVIR
jgi:hypothetical protein